MKRTCKAFLVVFTALGLPFLAPGEDSAFRSIDFPGASATQTWGINPRGDIVGFYTLPDKSSHGFLFDGDRYKPELCTPPKSVLAG